MSKPQKLRSKRFLIKRFDRQEVFLIRNSDQCIVGNIVKAEICLANLPVTTNQMREYTELADLIDRWNSGERDSQ